MHCIVTSAQYLRQLGRIYLRDRWPWLAVPLLVCAVLAVGMSDVRWLVVGLMVFFIAIPMVLALAYINYALSLEARWSVMGKSVTLGGDGILMRFDDERMHDRLLRPGDVAGVRVGGDAFLVMLNVRRYTFLMIPFAAVEQAGIPLHRFASQLRQLAIQ